MSSRGQVNAEGMNTENDPAGCKKCRSTYEEGGMAYYFLLTEMIAGARTQWIITNMSTWVLQSSCKNLLQLDQGVILMIPSFSFDAIFYACRGGLRSTVYGLRKIRCLCVLHKKVVLHTGMHSRWLQLTDRS